MKSIYLAQILLTIFLVASCSSEEDKEKSITTSRSSIPILNNKVQIGNQIWMTKNLDVSRYRNGDLIPQVTDAAQWSNMTTGAWCYYQNNSAFGNVYGKLYNWHAINDPRGIAPQGWHVASDSEFTVLSTFLGGEAIAGGKLKAINLWTNPNSGATNSSRFSALPGGWRDSNGQFGYSQDYGFWWCSTLWGFSFSYQRQLSFNDITLIRSNTLQNYGHSVRCVKD